MFGQKKVTDGSDGVIDIRSTEPPATPVVPPFRTWVVTTDEWEYAEKGETGQYKRIVYEAHDIEINPNGFVVFHVYFIHAVANALMQAPRYFLHPTTWRGIEEVNAMFSEPVKH